MTFCNKPFSRWEPAVQTQSHTTGNAIRFLVSLIKQRHFTQKVFSGCQKKSYQQSTEAQGDGYCPSVCSQAGDPWGWRERKSRSKPLGCLWDQGLGEMPFLHQDPDTPHPPHEHPVQMHLDIIFPTVLVPRSCQLASAQKNVSLRRPVYLGAQAHRSNAAKGVTGMSGQHREPAHPQPPAQPHLPCPPLPHLAWWVSGPDYPLDSKCKGMTLSLTLSVPPRNLILSDVASKKHPSLREQQLCCRANFCLSRTPTPRPLCKSHWCCWQQEQPMGQGACSSAPHSAVELFTGLCS